MLLKNHWKRKTRSSVHILHTQSDIVYTYKTQHSGSVLTSQRISCSLLMFQLLLVSLLWILCLLLEVITMSQKIWRLCIPVLQVKVLGNKALFLLSFWLQSVRQRKAQNASGEGWPWCQTCFVQEFLLDCQLKGDFK